jgi:hypothetical protein
MLVKVSHIAWNEVAMPDDAKKLEFDVLKDRYDTLTKGANLLLVAHGAGIVGCVAFAKEKVAMTLYGDISLFVFIFATGFMLAGSAYGILSILRMSALGSLIGKQEVRASFANTGEKIAVFFLVISFLNICAAAWGIIFTSLGMK